MMHALIVDDEAPGARTMQLLVEDYCPQVKIVATATTVKEALAAIRAHRPSLLFLDVELASESGFELLRYPECENIEVIFTTAYEQYAIAALRHDAVDYLLKPVDADELVRAVEKAEKNRQQQAEPSWRNAAPLAARTKRLALAGFDAIRYVEKETVMRLEASSNYTEIFFADGKKHTATRTLKEFEEQLVSDNFCRVHKAHLVNLDYVDKFMKTEGGYLLLKDGTSVPVSRQKKEELLRRLGG